jgi:hypothetical protein
MITAQLEEKKFEFEIEEQRLKSCCFDLHAESSNFFAKVTVSMSIIGLCSYQLITNEDCSYQSLYSSLLSTIIVFWLNKK